jgi:hypothetical protein
MHIGFGRSSRLPTMVGCGLWLLCCVPVALSQPRALEPIALDYTVAAGCDDQPMFLQRVRRRTAAATVVDAGTAGARVFHINVANKRGRFIAELRSDGKVSTLRATDCNKILDGIALTLALAIDPDLLSGGSDYSISREPNVQPPLSTFRDVELSLPDASAAPPDFMPAVSSLKKQRWSAAAALNGGAAFNLAPRLMATAELGVFVKRGMFAISLSVIAGGTKVAKPVPGFADAQVSYRWLTSRSGFCAVGNLATLQLAACADLEAGMLKLRPEAVVNASSSARLWLAPGVSGQLAWKFSDRWQLTAGVDFSFPIIKDRYVFRPNINIDSTAAVVVLGKIGIARRIF